MDTDEGISGWGEAYNHGPDKAPWCRCSNTCSCSSRARNPRRTEYSDQKLIRKSRFPPGAIGLAAISAIDHALWDIAAKALDLPVYRPARRRCRDRVRV